MLKLWLLTAFLTASASDPCEIYSKGLVDHFFWIRYTFSYDVRSSELSFAGGILAQPCQASFDPDKSEVDGAYVLKGVLRRYVDRWNSPRYIDEGENDASYQHPSEQDLDKNPVALRVELPSDKVIDGKTYFLDITWTRVETLFGPVRYKIRDFEKRLQFKMVKAPDGKFVIERPSAEIGLMK